jgi:aryl carrier-like protein
MRKEFNQAQTVSRTEAVLLPLWQDLLPGKTIDPEADLFDLGEDSLALMQLLNAVAATTGVEIDLAQVFRKCSLRYMAELVEDQQAGEQGEGP